jgi:hypothetical protein
MATVFVFSNEWADRHGDEGSTIEVFGTAAQANDYLAKDIRSYLHENDLMDGDNLALDRIHSFDTHGLHWNYEDYEDDTVITVGELVQAAIDGGWLEFNRDGEGTNSDWSVFEKKIL